MSENLSPRVRQLRDQARRDRLAREEAAGTRSKPGAPDAWLQKTRPDDLDIQVQGITDQAPAVSGDTVDPFALPDPGFGPVADSQAKAGGDLHALLENTPDDILQEAAERSLQQTRNETGAQAARTLAAASKLVGEIKNANILRVCREFLGREPRYVSDDEGLNWAALLKRMVADYCPGTIRVDEDDTEIATEYLFTHRHLTVEKMLASFQRLWDSDGLPVVLEGERSLSDRERRAAAIQAASGDVENAIVGLLQICLPSLGEVTSAQALFAALSAVENRDVVFDCVFTCVAATPQALAAGMRDDAQTRQAVYAALGVAPITVQNVMAAFSQVQKSRSPRSLPQISAAAANRAPSAQELDDLSDSEIDTLLNGVVKDRARSMRRLL